MTLFLSGEASDFGDNFIPEGLFWDLIDNTPNEEIVDPNNSDIDALDEVEDFTPFMLFNSLSPNVNSISDFKERLKTNHLQATSNPEFEVDDLIDVYDVFN